MMHDIVCVVACLILQTVLVQTEELPHAAAEIVKAAEQEADQIRIKTETEIATKRAAAIPKLQEIQDTFTREAKLDEAVAIRDKIRGLKSPELNQQPSPPPRIRFQQANTNAAEVQHDELPPQAGEIIKKLEQELDQIRSKMDVELKSKREITIQKLQEVQNTFTRDAKLDEALAIREKIRGLKSAGLKALPNPGNLVHYRGQNGTVLIFQVTGGANRSIYGTDIYTDDSDLSAAAVHANVLKPNQTGLVKVTILPGQDSYLSTTRNGINSSPYFQYPGSFKVQSLFGGTRPAPVDSPPKGDVPMGAPGGAVFRLDPFVEPPRLIEQ